MINAKDLKFLKHLYKAHPWHGVSIGEGFPDVVTVYIEVVPNDTVKYELDKNSGLLVIDRPQRFSNVSPTLYGMLPQTYCGNRVAQYCKQMSGIDAQGDKDPLDICVLTEKLVPHGDILLTARPIGGFRMIDNGEVDDKIIAVMKDDASYGEWGDLSDCPRKVIDRLEHYFLTYKAPPKGKDKCCKIIDKYNKKEAHTVIKYAYEDYAEEYNNVMNVFNAIGEK